MGPFSIVQRVGPLAYQMKLGTCYIQVHLIFHVSLFKPFHAGGDGDLHPTAVYIEDVQEWEISGILLQKRSGTRRKYLVAYAGYNESKAFWLLESMKGYFLSNAQRSNHLIAMHPCNQ